MQCSANGRVVTIDRITAEVLRERSGLTRGLPIGLMVDRGFYPRSGQTKDCKIGICCFSANHAALRRKRKDWLARTQNNVHEGATFLPTDCCFGELAQ